MREALRVSQLRDGHCKNQLRAEPQSSKVTGKHHATPNIKLDFSTGLFLSKSLGFRFKEISFKNKKNNKLDWLILP